MKTSRELRMTPSTRLMSALPVSAAQNFSDGLFEESRLMLSLSIGWTLYRKKPPN
jgi:hypothetical protein